jgi:DNA-binding XRE family transcriptional regulator
MISNQKPKLDVRNISINLYTLRTKLNYTHEQMAEILNVSVRVIYMWESGTKCPALKRLIVIALTFEVTVDSILRLS